MLPPNETERQQIAETIFGGGFASHASGPELKAYFRHYVSVVCPAATEEVVIDVDNLTKCHADILRCVEILHKHPELALDEFITKAVHSEEPIIKEKEHIARVTVDIAFMINCGLRDYHSDGFKCNDLGIVKWQGDSSFVEFVKQAFTSQLFDTEEQQRKNLEAVKHKKALKAWKLSRRSGIEIKATNNLLEHLAYDSKTRILKIFHQMSFLRAHLERTRDEPLDMSFEDSLKRGTLPPRLLLETLLTFHTILFPIASAGDKRSHSMLGKMIRKQGFDQEGKWVGFVRPLPPDMVYMYWGDRLAKLYEVVKRPPPTNPVVAWFERHTSERNALTVAILGLFLAVLFGFLSVILGLLQLVVAWLAWKYPVS
ncbi:hypothetical protein BKA56DRAFT_597532 [Ilyonectria sp. MPI-CAGE-AT-0026]|nr:hypothetical protein BKA56DRAFT_597532 [Ilyonectria sp. MPI-CAGE-AT-0026]